MVALNRSQRPSRHRPRPRPCLAALIEDGGAGLPRRLGPILVTVARGLGLG